VSSGGVGHAGVFCDYCVRAFQAQQAGQIPRADGVLGARSFERQGGLAVACAVGGVVVEVVAALGGGGGVSVAKKRVWAGGEAVLGFWQRGAARGVACVGVWGVDMERVSGVGRVDRRCALGWLSGACAVDFSGCVVERAA